MSFWKKFFDDKESNKEPQQQGKNPLSPLADQLVSNNSYTRDKAVLLVRQLANEGKREGLDALEEAIRFMYEGQEEIQFHVPVSGATTVNARDFVEAGLDADKELRELAGSGLLWRTQPKHTQKLLSRLLSMGGDLNLLLREITSKYGDKQGMAVQLLLYHGIVTATLNNTGMKCDVCSTSVPIGSGYILTTYQVVTQKEYWAFYLRRYAEAAGAKNLSLSEAEALLPILVPQQCAQETGWLVCDRCISMFKNVDRDVARGYLRQWLLLSPGGAWVPPGAGPVNPLEIVVVATAAVYPNDPHQSLKAPQDQVKDVGAVLGNSDSPSGPLSGKKVWICKGCSTQYDASELKEGPWWRVCQKCKGDIVHNK
ncbi:MAG: hypothetical protein HY226_04420 [Candidatus Vogelbacteria bacterium]|nr:hypothetical protein [Candidatus Vogelbacteria bacterium]